MTSDGPMLIEFFVGPCLQISSGKHFSYLCIHHLY